MMENLEHNMEGIFQEIVKVGRENGAVSQEAFHDMIEQVIEDHRRVGEIHTDSSTDGMSEQLKNRWKDYRTALGLDEKNTQL